jgi:hypothetical protein
MQRRAGTACLLLILCLSALPQLAPSPVEGQQGGGFGNNSRIDWNAVTDFSNLQARQRNVEKRFLFVYVKPASETQEPTLFANYDFVAASRGSWLFAWLDYDAANPWLKRWGVRAAHTIIGGDLHGNAFQLTTNMSMNAVRPLMDAVPDLIAKFSAKVKADYDKALETAKADEEKGVKALVDLALQPIQGYKPIQDALAKVTEIGVDALAKADVASSVSVENGIAFLEGIVKLYRETPPGVQAEIRIAKLEQSRNNVAAAVQRLQQIQKHDPRLLKKEIDEAAALLAEMGKAVREAAAAKLPAQRLAEPSTVAQSEASKSIREIFKADFGKRTAEDQRSLARKLLEQGIATGDDATVRYVLFREARDLAVQAADPALAAEAVDEMARWYAVDPAAMKVATLAKITSKAPAVAKALAEAYRTVMEQALSADQFDLAVSVSSKAEAAAKAAQDPGLALEMAAISREVAAIQKEYSAVKPHLKTIEEKPDDPAANLAAGLFFCLFKGQWEKGLPMLAKGSDAALKATAEKELAAPKEGAAQAALAEDWIVLSEKESAPARKARMKDRARFWYETALPNLTGLTKLKAERRIQEIAAAAAPRGAARAPVNLLKWIDVKLDAAQDGSPWEMQGDSLVCQSRDFFSRIEIPCIPPEEYDLKVVVERKRNNENMNVGLVAGGRQFALQIDINSRLSTLSLIDNEFGWRVRQPDPSFLYQGGLLTNDKPSTIVCSVRKNRLTVTVDGKQILDFKGEWNRLSLSQRMKVAHDNTLFVGAGCHYAFSEIALTPLSGPPKRAR